jgi:hypothetical protein
MARHKLNKRTMNQMELNARVYTPCYVKATALAHKVTVLVCAKVPVPLRRLQTYAAE